MKMMEVIYKLPEYTCDFCGSRYNDTQYCCQHLKG